MRHPTGVTLTERERSVLATPSSSPQTALRRRIVLLAAEGWFNVDIAAELGVAVSTVALWRGRFAADGLTGLHERRRTGRPRQVDRTAILRTTLRPRAEAHLGDDSPSRRLADELGVSVATVRRTWQEFGVLPRPDGAFAFHVEPELVATTVDIVGIYRTPRSRVAALVLGRPTPSSADSSAAHRVQPVPTCSTAAVAHGQLTASALARLAPDQGLIAFLTRLATANAGRRVHLVGDGAGLVRTLRAFGQACPSAEFPVHVAVDAASWSRLVQVWQLMAGSVPGADRPPPSARSSHPDGPRVVWFKAPPLDVVAAS